MAVPVALRIALLALASGEDIVGTETRRTGRMVILASVVVILIATGAVQPEAISGLGLQLSGEVATLRAVLLLVLSLSLVMFALRLLTDLERVTRLELFSRTTRLQLRTQAEVRRLEEAELLDGHVPPSGRGDSGADRVEQLQRTRLEHLYQDLADLKHLGETGSRFTRFAADRQFVENEIKKVLTALNTMGGDQEESLSEDSPLPPRLRISASHLTSLIEISELQTEFSGSGLVRVARRLRVALDVCLAPSFGVAALIVWALAI